MSAARLLAGCIVLLLAATAFQDAPPTSRPAGERDPGQWYTSAEHRYKLHFPSDWRAEESDGGNITVQARQEDGSVLHPPTVAVQVRDLDMTYAVRQVADQVQAYMEGTGATLQDRRSGLRLGGRAAERLAWRWTIEDELEGVQADLFVVQFVAVRNLTAFTVTFTCEFSQQQGTAATFETIYRTFAIGN